VHGQEYELRIRYLFPDSSGSIQAVQERHREIRNNYIRSEPDGFCQQRSPIRYRSNDSKCLLQIDRQSIGEDRVVIGDQDARETCLGGGFP
jgi:hypothetical protein